jgi:hypothetical protein
VFAASPELPDGYAWHTPLPATASEIPQGRRG